MKMRGTAGDGRTLKGSYDYDEDKFRGLLSDDRFKTIEELRVERLKNSSIGQMSYICDCPSQKRQVWPTCVSTSCVQYGSNRTVSDNLGPF